MKLAVMQPYFFPYIGYFQLIKSVDKFVFLDDVNFINRGWINRNRLLVNGNAKTFTVPLQNASQNKLINEISIAGEEWKTKTLKTIEYAYKKAPFFQLAINLIKEIVLSSVTDIAALAKRSIEAVCSYLEIKTSFVFSSVNYRNSILKNENRIIDIAVKEDATDYINAIGGSELYTKKNFLDKNIRLHFLKPSEIIYPQFNNSFISNLSVIDVLMFNEKKTVQEMLSKFELT